VFIFDLTTLAPDQMPKLFSVSKPIRRRGQVDGICMYFKAIFDDDISFVVDWSRRRQDTLVDGSLPDTCAHLSCWRNF